MKTSHLIARSLLLLALFSTLNYPLSTTHAQGTAFTYNGRLNDGTNPATGSYDLTFTLYTAATGGTVAGALTNAATPINNGLFTVPLDFGAVFNGANYWLELAARTNGGGAFSTLSPRQPVLPTPYAIYAANASSAGSVAAANIFGTVPLAQLPAVVVTNNEGGITLNGTFNGNGSGLTNVNLTGPSALSALTSSAIGYLALASNTTGNENTANGFYALNSNTNGIGNTANGYYALSQNTSGSWNAANGVSALQANTTGSENTASGGFALYRNTTGYFNTANGENALFSNTTGYANTANGYGSLQQNISGVYNTANGASALEFNTSGSQNTADGESALQYNTTGNHNTAIGYIALYNNTNASDNTANGFEALYNNTSGYWNTASGSGALQNNTTAYRNTAAGFDALYANTTGTTLTAVGAFALQNNTTGGANTAVGDTALQANTTGVQNAATGNGALQSNTTGNNNTADGFQALWSNTTGVNNTAVGYQALQYNTTGSYDTANGFAAMSFNTNGNYNTANGYATLNRNTSGNNNTANGSWSLYYNTTGSNNIALGYNAGYNLTTGSSNIDIGNMGLATDTNIIRIGSGQTQAFIAGVITGNGGGLTNLNAATLTGTGTLPAGVLPASVAFLNSNQTFTGVNTFTNRVVFGTPPPFTRSVQFRPAANCNFDIFAYGGGNGITIESVDDYNSVNEPLEFRGVPCIFQSNVSIGDTTNNAEKLEVDGSDATIRIRNLNDAIGGFVGNTYGSVQLGMYNPSANSQGVMPAGAKRSFFGFNQNGIIGSLVNNFPNNIPTTANFRNVLDDGNGNMSIAGVITGNGGGLTNVNLTGLSASSALGNEANGYQALASNTTGTDNSANGYQALVSNTSGINNTANGYQALQFNTVGNWNLADGFHALRNNSSGSQNTANAYDALANNTTGNNNTADGFRALFNNTTGNTNIALGNYAGYNITTGSYNLDIGNQGVATDTNIIRIGDIQTQAFIAGVITGNGGGLTNLNGASMTGTVPNLNVGSISVISNIYLPTISAASGIIYSGSSPLMHGDNLGNFFVGVDAGNLTLSANYDTGIGISALHNNTTGGNNSASGYSALYFNTIGSYNTANGDYALFNNISGNFNSGNGHYALAINTSGSYNVANGAFALNQNTTGNNNIALGYQAGDNITTGSYNIDIGNTGVVTDTNIIRIGSGQTQAFIAGVITGNGGGLTNLNMTGPSFNSTLGNTAYGYNALLLNSNGFQNTALGYNTLVGNTSGADNTAVGWTALPNNTTGGGNTAVGQFALGANTTGSGNTAYGQNALLNSTGNYNTASGDFALINNTAGNNNIALGYKAGYNITTGNTNIDIGNLGLATDTNIIRIGDGQTATYLAGTVYANGVALTSDRNAKENFRAVDYQAVLAKVAALPVTEWNYKAGDKAVQHIGPMAQDFQAAFQLSADDKHISVVDEGGVALAAIQGLNEKLNEKDAEIEALKQSVAELKQMLQTLAAKK